MGRVTAFDGSGHYSALNLDANGNDTELVAAVTGD
jgi:hypothetical protein